jgi:S1-C subfamily serine protease
VDQRHQLLQGCFAVALLRAMFLGRDDEISGLGEKPARKQGNESVGTGVVIVDKGVILTNLHVVAGASKITVVFADGLESEATVIGVRPGGVWSGGVWVGFAMRRS